MKIAILGATGSIGSPTAFHIAEQGLADEILLIGGKRQNVLLHHELDIETAVSAKDIRVRAGKYEDLTGTDIVINAGVPHPKRVIKDRKEMLLPNITLVRDIALKISQYCPAAIIISVNNPVGPLLYAAYRSGGFQRRQLIGYTANDSFRFRQWLAAAFGVKVSQIDGMVIGEHGATQVLLFSSARIDGKPISFSEDQKASLRGEVPKQFEYMESLNPGRTAGYTCAVGIAAIVRAIVNDTGDVLPCAAVLDGEYGYSGLGMTVPVVVGREGIRKIIEYDLAADEKKALEISVNTLKEAVSIVEETLGLQS